LDPQTSLAWLEQFYRGLATCARRYRVPIVGGDIAQADGVLAASLTLLGAAAGSRVVTRTGARIGDSIYVTGVLGRSLASGHHFAFHPRLAEGTWLAGRPEVRAMMDLSDGLAKDLGALTPPRAKPALEPDALPLRRGADLRAALTDGEDYELVFALAAHTDAVAFARAWHRRFPRTRLTNIGHFARSNALSPSHVRLEDFSGYEHLR
jgi:thiamine-monophosphate kinase